MRPRHLRNAAVAAAVIALVVAHALIAMPILRGWPWPAIAGSLALAVILKYLVWRVRSRKRRFGS